MPCVPWVPLMLCDPPEGRKLRVPREPPKALQQMEITMRDITANDMTVTSTAVN